MAICRGVLSLKSILASDKNMYFWIKMEQSRVSQISIASSFQKIFKRDQIYLLGQIRVREEFWGFVKINILEIAGLQINNDWLFWIEMEVVEANSKSVKDEFTTDYVVSNNKIMKFKKAQFWTRIIGPDRYYLKLKLNIFKEGKKCIISEKRMDLSDFIRQ